MVMLKQKKIVVFFMLLIGMSGLFTTGCSKADEMGAKAVSGGYLTIIDDLGRTVNLEKEPEKIIALSPSFLAPLGAVDAKLIGRTTSKTGVPEFAQTIEEVGAVYNINLEKVVALKPDLVIAYQGMHDKFVPILETNRIPVIVVRLKTYQDVQDKLRLFAKIAGQAKKGEDLALAMDEKIQATIALMPKEQKRIAILHSTAKSVTVELDGSIAGCVAKMLGFTNVASGRQSLEKDPDSTPYSLEILVESNPEIIFVATMGNLEEIKKRMLADVESNPAWSSLVAVQNKKVYFLPQELFLLNPGLDYPKAAETMAKFAYPEVFGDVQ